MEIYKKLFGKLSSTCKLENFLEKCSSLKTDAKRIKYILTLLDTHKHTLKINDEGKSVSKCTDLKNEGNKLYASSNSASQLDLIIETYTKSIAYAPPTSRELLSIVYANRSAVLFTARLYEDCLQDIERALKLNYPDNLRAKLFARKARCLIALKRPGSDEAVEETRRCLSKLETTDPKRKSVEKTLNDPKFQQVEKPRQILDDRRNFPEIIPNDNPDIPGASSAIRLNYNEKYGRHIVATRDIEPGELLFIEHPYTAVIEFKKRYNLCENCLKATWSAIPCDHCVNVVYCSESCREAAWSDHHDLECQIIGSLIAHEVTTCSGLSALRLTVKALKEAGSLQSIKEQLQSFDSITDSHTRMIVDNSSSNNYTYQTIYNLKRKLADVPLIQLASFVETTVVLYNFATKTNILGEKFDENLTNLRENKWLKFFTGFVLQNSRIGGMSMSTVMELSRVESLWRGYLIAPFSGLMSHSCCPNTACCFYRTDQAIYSKKFIKEGEQIFTCYNTYQANHTVASKKERQAYLLPMMKTLCDCVACTNDWPLEKDLPRSHTVLPIDLQYELSKRTSKFMKYAKLVKDGDFEDKPEVLTGLIEMARVFGKYNGVPSRETYSITYTLQLAIAQLANRQQKLD